MERVKSSGLVHYSFSESNTKKQGNLEIGTHKITARGLELLKRRIAKKEFCSPGNVVIHNIIPIWK